MPPELPAGPLPALTVPSPPPKPHPIEVAVAALNEFATETLTSDRPSRFAELQSILPVILAVQRLRVPVSVEDVGDPYAAGGVAINGVVGGGFNVMAPQAPIRMAHGGVRWNDQADLQTQILMVAQQYLQHYIEAEQKKINKPEPDVRLDVVSELAELYMLRLKLAGSEQPIDVPEEITTRITHLLKRIGEPSHEPASDPVVPAEPVRGHQADGPGQADGAGVGEALAERAPGDGRAGQEV